MPRRWMNMWRRRRRMAKGGTAPVAMAGGLLLSAPDIARSMLEHLQSRGYEPIPTPVTEPARGALVLARQIHHD